MKKFEIGMIIQAIDRVTGPAKGITASIRKMAHQSEEAAAKESLRAGHHAKQHAEKHSHGIGERFHEGIGKGFEAVGELSSVIGIVGGIEGLVEGYKKVTEASDEARAAQTRLSTMMLHVKGNTKEDVAAVNELAERLEGKTAYEHTIFETAAAGLSSFGISGKQVQKFLPVMADLIAKQKGLHATNEDAAESAKLIGKAFAGNTGALRRAGIILTPVQEAILKTGTAAQRMAVLAKGIESRAGGLASKQANDPEGQAQRAKNALKLVSQKIGDALIPIRLGVMKALSGALPYVSKFADMLPSIFARAGAGLQVVGKLISGQFMKGFGGINSGQLFASFRSFVPVIQGLISKVGPLLAEFGAYIVEIFGWVGKVLIDVWIKSQPGLKALVEAFVPLLDVIGNLWHKILQPFWTGFLMPFYGWLAGMLVPFIINVLGPTFKFLAQAIGFILNLLIDLSSKLFTSVGKAWKTLSGFFGNLWTRIKISFGAMRTVLSSVWQDIWNGLFQWVSDRWGDFLNIFKSVGNFLGIGGGDDAPSKPRFSQLPISQAAVNSNVNASATVKGRIHVTSEKGTKVHVSGDLSHIIDSRLGFQGLH